tara:strand:+ start:52 stop:984 length:933 start_codon:yes stop_codon:yes gene_type:complete
MLSFNSININSFKIGDDLEHDDAPKQYYGDVRVQQLSLPEYKIYADDEDLVFDERDELTSFLEGRAMTNRLKIGSWHMYTNDDVMTIEHELAHSRSSTNTVEMTYNDMYMTDVVMNPSEKMNLRLVKLEIQCADDEEANFARETLVSTTASECEAHVRDNVLCVGLCFESTVFHTPRTLCSAYFLHRNVKVIQHEALDVGGFELPVNFEVGEYKDDVITVSESENGSGLIVNDDDMPHLQLDYDTRYIFRGPGIQQFDVDARYLTEKGFILKEDFYIKPYKYKYVVIHPEDDTKYTYKRNGRQNDILVIS